MSSLNRVTLIGNLTRDPELRTVGQGAQVCDLGLAINRSWTDSDGQKREETTFVEIAFWGKTADNILRFLKKGRSVYVEGRLQLDTWQDSQTGQDRSKLKIVGERIQFLGGNAQEMDEPAPSQPSRSSQPQRGRYQQRRVA
ncbi:MAG: single-stranded DNA-binding protein [Verrucomicrobiae bacterium]|nr:single-stranded DNA-binding protein [Verrucomicrobiae bacterium]